MISIAYCDDERAALQLYPEQVRAAFQQYHRTVEIECFQQPLALMESISANNRYNLLFLDISMPNLNGIELGKQLRKIADNVLIVFVSSHEELVFESFQVTPFRFIRKGHFYQDLEECIPAIITELEKRQTSSKSTTARRSTGLRRIRSCTSKAATRFKNSSRYRG